MSKSFLERFVESQPNMRRFQQERAILQATGEICVALESQSLTRAELAERLNKTPGWVTQLLDGKKNKTIRTVADVLAVLGREMHISSRPISIGSRTAEPTAGSLAARRKAAHDADGGFRVVSYGSPTASSPETVEMELPMRAAN